MDISLRAGRMRLSGHNVVNDQFEEYSAVLSETLLEQLRPTIESLTGFNLSPTYSFWRLYQPGAILRPHVDRAACEVSVSISIASEPKKSVWPLFITDLNGTDVCLNLRSSDAVIYMGCDLPHWREMLEDGVCYNLFLHYVRKDGPRARYIYDMRNSLAAPKASASALTIGAKLPAQPTIEKHVFGDQGTIYRASLFQLIDRNSILKSVQSNCEINPDETHDNNPLKPGLQSNIIIRSEELTKLETLVSRIVMSIGVTSRDFFDGALLPKKNGKRKNVSKTDFVINYWLFIADKNVQDKSMGWHNHEEMLLGERSIRNGASWVYYIQLPDNIDGEEGQIQFTDRTCAIGLLPEEGDLFCFPPKMLHRVRAAPNSKRKRIVIAGTMQLATVIKSSAKKRKR